MLSSENPSDLGIEPGSPALQANSLSSETQVSENRCHFKIFNFRLQKQNL